MELLLVLVACFSAVFAAETTSLASSYNTFAADVYKTLSQTNDGNFAASPLSAAVILTLAQTGAKGPTASEIQTSLHLQNQNTTDSEVTSLLSSFDTSTYTFALATKLFVKNGYKIEEEFLNRARTSYQADVENVNFSQSAAAADVINRWVETQTNDKIKNLVDPQNLAADTRLLLANAIYFKGFWQRPFWVYQTKKQDFFKSANETVQVDTMVKVKYFHCHESAALNARFLKLGFSSKGAASMVIVLPNEIEGLSSVEKNVEEIFSPVNFTRTRINLRLPKFEIESKIALNSVLQSLGIQKAFANDADFSGISATEKLQINNVLQKVVVKVHEKGVEAAAATYFDMIPLSGEYPDETVPKDFFVDRPFIFYLRIEGVIAFVGRVTDPS